MDRRAFVTSTLGTTLLAATGLSGAQRSGGGETANTDLFVWQQYSLRTGTGPRRLADYLQNAYIPALNGLGHKPIGVFKAITSARIARRCACSTRWGRLKFSGVAG